MPLQPSCKVLCHPWQRQDCCFGRLLNAAPHAPQCLAARHIITAFTTTSSCEHRSHPLLHLPLMQSYFPCPPLNHSASNTIACPSTICPHAGYKRTTSDAQLSAQKTGSGLKHSGLTSWIMKSHFHYSSKTSEWRRKPDFQNCLLL